MIPAAAHGEVVKLKDQSTVRGRLAQVVGDTLVFRTTFGTLRFHRSQVVSIVFDDSLGTPLVIPAPATTAPTVAAPAGKGRIEVVFKDRELSSKIAIELKKEWDEHVSSNHILVELVVDGRTVYSEADTSMDKTIHKGHTTVLKNTIELADFGVDVADGLHHAKLVVRNRDVTTFRKDFDPEPLDMVVTVRQPGDPARRGVSPGRWYLEREAQDGAGTACTREVAR
jgi:hypothetical protein